MPHPLRACVAAAGCVAVAATVVPAGAAATASKWSPPALTATFTKVSYAPGERCHADRPHAARSGSSCSSCAPAPSAAGAASGARGDRRRRGGSAAANVHKLIVRPGAWQSGLYFARLTAPGGRRRHVRAVRPARGRAGSRIASRSCCRPTRWQAYNFYDANGDGKPDSWYGDPKRHSVSARAAVPQLGEAAALPHAAARVPALPRAHGQAGGLPLRRGPREVRVGRRPREALRPRHLLGARGVRDAADLRRRAALPRSRRQPRVPLGEQLLPARRAVERDASGAAGSGATSAGPSRR